MDDFLEKRYNKAIRRNCKKIVILHLAKLCKMWYTICVLTFLPFNLE